PDVLKTLPKPNIPYHSRLNDQKLCEKAINQMAKFFQIFQDLHFDISFADALLLMPKFSSTIKSLLANKDKLFELAKIPLNENCSAMLLKKLLEKLGSFFQNKALTLCNLSSNTIPNPKGEMKAITTRNGVSYEGPSIPTNPSSKKDKLFELDKIPLNENCSAMLLKKLLEKLGRALIDVYGEEKTLRVNDEAETFNLNQTTRYSSIYDDMSINRIDVVSEEYAQEVLGFSKNSSSGNPTSTSKPIISNSSHSLTPFEGSDFILEEIEAYLKDDSVSPEINHANCDPEGDICLIEKLLNNDPFQLPPMDLKQE
nr:reverse transcriptase domain-containing protein [Tanacetum cinerariifolium]